MFVQLNMAILPLMATTKYHLTEPIKTKRAKIKRHIKEQGPHLWQKQVFQKKKKTVFQDCAHSTIPEIPVSRLFWCDEDVFR